MSGERQSGGEVSKEPSSDQTQSVKSQFIWWLGLCLLAGAVRCVGILESSLWFDESMSWRTVQLQWGEMFHSLTHNTHPPLFFCVLKIWTSLFGESLLALRSMNVLVAMLTVPMIGVLCRTGFPPHPNPLPQKTEGEGTAGLWAALLFAVCPFHIRLAGEVRMYPLLVLLVVCSSWLLMKAIHEPNRLRGWIWYGVSMLGMMYTHYVAIFSIAGQFLFLCIWILRAERSTRFANCAGCVISSMILIDGWSVWLPVFLAQRQKVANHWWSSELDGYHLETMAIDLVASSDAFRGTAAAVVAGLVLCGVWLWIVWQRKLFANFLAVGIASSFLLPVAYSMLSTNIMVSRYFAPMQILWLIGWAFCLLNRNRWLKASVIVTTFAGIHTCSLWRTNPWEKPGVVAAVRWIEHRAEDSDQLLADSTLIYFPALYHAHDRKRLKLLDTLEVSEYFAGGPVLRNDDLFYPDDIADSTNVVWFLSSEIPAPRVLGNQWRMADREFFAGTSPFQQRVSVTKYVLMPPASD